MDYKDVLSTAFYVRVFPQYGLGTAFLYFKPLIYKAATLLEPRNPKAF